MIINNISVKLVSLLLFLCLSLHFPMGVLAYCSCNQDASVIPTLQQCTGDNQTFIGETEFYVGDWTTCGITVFTSSLSISPYDSSQALHISSGGSLFIYGDLTIPPTTSNYNITIVADDMTQNSSIEIFGNLIVNGRLIIDVQYIVIHGNVIISSTGDLTVLEEVLHISGNITAQANCTFEGESNVTAMIEIDGSVVGLPGASFLFSYSTVTIKGGINAPNTDLTIEAITVTSLTVPSVIVRSVILVMEQIDMGNSHLGVPYQIFQAPASTLLVKFLQEWSCGNYQVTANISTSKGLSVILNAPPLTINDNQYCCFENMDFCVCAMSSSSSIPPECVQPCVGWVCDTAGVVAGWVVGGVMAVVILSVACTLLARDFIDAA